MKQMNPKKIFLIPEKFCETILQIQRSNSSIKTRYATVPKANKITSVKKETLPPDYFFNKAAHILHFSTPANK